MPPKMFNGYLKIKLITVPPMKLEGGKGHIAYYLLVKPLFRHCYVVVIALFTL